MKDRINSLASVRPGRLVRLKEAVSVSPDIANQLNLREMTKRNVIYGLVPASFLKNLSLELKENFKEVPDESLLCVITDAEGLVKAVTATEKEAEKYMESLGWEPTSIH